MLSYSPLTLHQKHHSLGHIKRIHNLIVLGQLYLFYIADQAEAGFDRCGLGQTLKHLTVFRDDLLKDLLTTLIFCRVSLLGKEW